MAKHANLSRLEQWCEDLGMTFTDLDLLRSGLTHSSFRNEHRHEGVLDNERLEFLGDAVLELCVSEHLFARYPAAVEGELTRRRAKIVCEPALAQCALHLDIPSHLQLGKGEEQTGGRVRPSLLADAFEAMLGALYLDQGISAVKVFLATHFYPLLEQASARTLQDHKTVLQEFIQREGLGDILYETVEERGPAHEREFVVRVKIAGLPTGVGSGKTKKEAEQLAAKQALQSLTGSA